MKEDSDRISNGSYVEEKIDKTGLEARLTNIISPNGEVVEVVKTEGNDQALQFAEAFENVEIHPERDAKLRWKIDLILLPIFAFLYMIQFMDKTCVGYAAIMGLKKDYKMEGQMYSWVNSCFYLGYLCACPLSSWMLQKLPTVWTVGICVIIWGLIQALTSACKSYATFVLLRTMLGIFESFITPIFVIILNQYYKKNEHFGRMAFFYGFNGLGIIVLSALTSGVYKNKDGYSIRSYDVLFIIIGLWTIVWGVIILLVVPNTPTEARWLTQEEKAMVVARIRENQQGFGAKEFKKYQLIECLKDIRSWIYFLIAILVAIPNGGVTSFMSIIIQQFGYDTLMTLYMNFPTGAVEIVFLCTLPILSRFIKSRMLIANIYLCACIIGTCLIAFVGGTGGLVGCYILGVSPVGIIMVTSCVSSNTAGHTKKLAANAFSLIGYSVGNMIGPQTFVDSDAPNYKKAKDTMIGCYCGAVFVISILAIYNIRENRRRDKFKADQGENYVVIKNQEFADLTDFENPEFRYAY